MKGLFKFSKQFFTIFIILTSLIFITACSQDKNRTVRIGCLNSYGAMQVYIALEEGYFEKAGVDVEVIPFKSSNLVAEAVFNNHVDIGLMISSLPYFALAVNDKSKFKLFQVGMATKEFSISKIIVSTKSDINSFKDLRGKTIGLLPGSAQQVYCRIGMHKTFGPDVSYKTINLPPQAHLEALSSGRIDAVFTIEPIATIGKEKGLARIIGGDALAEFVLGRYPSGASAISTKFLHEHPELAKKTISIFYRAMNFSQNHNVVARKHLAKNLDLEENIVLKMGAPSKGALQHNEFDYKAMQPAIDFYAKEGIIEEDFPIEVICLDKSFTVK
ncbi:MAG: ABC transporter substrate-binding protein [Spirochaetes bacterium]|jgi:NitT/TauT family transport system substrate-binding protein|nr:ABC transporter substrate-binding protein [Spirochaetota bacterium]